VAGRLEDPGDSVVPRPTVGIASFVLGIGRVFMVTLGSGAGAGVADAGVQTVSPEAAANRSTSRRDSRRGIR
jgi:hypothetical protein